MVIISASGSSGFSAWPVLNASPHTRANMMGNSVNLFKMHLRIYFYPLVRDGKIHSLCHTQKRASFAAIPVTCGNVAVG